MTRKTRHSLVSPAAWTCAALLMGACATTSEPKVATPPPLAAAPAADARPQAAGPGFEANKLPARERVNRAIILLGHGQAQMARGELQMALAAEPSLASAQTLLKQIDGDPKKLLSQKAYPYKIRPGETLSVLAARFLGDPLLFYALARYNGIDRPEAATAGRTLMIPGAPKPTPRPATVAKPVAPSGDPARASGLRRTALEAMNRGSIDQAVALLQQAAPLDPGNTLIRADLQRALKIQQSVRNR